MCENQLRGNEPVPWLCRAALLQQLSERCHSLRQRRESLHRPRKMYQLRPVPSGMPLSRYRVHSRAVRGGLSRESHFQRRIRRRTYRSGKMYLLRQMPERLSVRCHIRPMCRIRCAEPHQGRTTSSGYGGPLRVGPIQTACRESIRCIKSHRFQRRTRSGIRKKPSGGKRKNSKRNWKAELRS